AASSGVANSGAASSGAVNSKATCNAPLRKEDVMQ
nr:hypothetical protein [Tanacetum cinerariifolium]